MQVVIRNFIKLLSAGAFHSNNEIEEMSEYKWNQLLYIAKINNVDDFITFGIIYSEKLSNAVIPSNIKEKINNEIYNNETTHASQEYQYKPINNSIKKFSNSYLNKKLNKIIFDEVHCIDTSVDTITFLTKSIDNVNNLLSSKSYLRDLIMFGLYLREYGNKIDFIKIENWLSILKMKKIMNLIALYLITYFNFDAEEIPFYTKSGKDKSPRIKLPIETIQKIKDETDDSTKEPNILIYNIPKPSTSMFKYFSYYPIETLSIYFTNIFKSLSNIEE